MHKGAPEARFPHPHLLGIDEHPTQALLDALTIRGCKGRLGGLTMAIGGDILHSRAVRSTSRC